MSSTDVCATASTFIYNVRNHWHEKHLQGDKDEALWSGRNFYLKMWQALSCWYQQYVTWGSMTLPPPSGVLGSQHSTCNMQYINLQFRYTRQWKINHLKRVRYHHNLWMPLQCRLRQLNMRHWWKNQYTIIFMYQTWDCTRSAGNVTTCAMWVSLGRSLKSTLFEFGNLFFSKNSLYWIMSQIKIFISIYCIFNTGTTFHMPSHIKEHDLFSALCTRVVLSFRTAFNEVYQHRTVNISFGYKTIRQSDEVFPLCHHYIIKVQ